MNSDGALSPANPAAGPSVQVPLSVAPKVYGVLSIVFAAMCTLMSLASGCMMGMMRSGSYQALATAGLARNPGVEAAYAEYMKSTYAASVCSTVLFLVFSVLLLIIGVGQVGYRRWARGFSIYWAVAGLAGLVLLIVLNQMMVSPAIDRFYQAMAAAMPAGSMEARLQQTMRSLVGGGFTTWVTTLLYAPYPILLLLTFTRPRVREAMQR